VGQISAREHARLADVRAALSAIQDGDDRVQMDAILTELRELLGLEQAALFHFEKQASRIVLERVQVAGARQSGPEIFALAKEHFRGSRRWALYDPLRPEPEQRNRAMVVSASLETLARGANTREAREAKAGAELGLNRRQLRDRLAAFERTDKEVLHPMGWAGREQVRVLLCDGDTLMGWLGGTGFGLGAREMALLQAVAPAFHQRLKFERLIASAEIARAGMAAALEALGAPAFIVDAEGRVHHANTFGSALLGDPTFRSRLELGISGQEPLPGLELTAIRSKGLPSLSLAIVREVIQAPDARLADAATRWTLTRRETEVLNRLVQGETNKVIAANLGCAEATVEIHVTRLLAKARAPSRVALAISYWRGP
jgi:DNA-binding NarL/FixJ family response regulator